jgi:putative sterol carrier protein
MVKFLSEEWIEAGKKYILEELDPETDLKNLSTSMLGIVEHIPPDDSTMSFYFEFDNGKMIDFIVSSGDGPQDKTPTYEVRGNYGTYKDALQGKTSLTILLLKNRLKLKGSKLQALKIIKPLDKVIDSLIKITDEFD